MIDAFFNHFVFANSKYVISLNSDCTLLSRIKASELISEYLKYLTFKKKKHAA